MPTDLEMLLEMGFTQNRAQRALTKTNYQGIEAAMNWLEAHENDPDIDDEFVVPEGQNIADTGEAPVEGSSSEVKLQAKSLKCDECGKLLKSAEAAEVHAVRSGHSQFSESVEEVKPLTEEERQAQISKAQELLKQKRLEREEKEKQEQLDREKQRRVHGKEMSQIRQKMQEDEMKKIMDERRRDKEAEKLARQRVREQIEKDKEDRAAKFGTATSSTGNQPASNSSTAAQVGPTAVSQTAAVSSSSTSQPRVVTETNLQIRLFDGQTVVQKFSVNEPLAAVRLFVHGKLTGGHMQGDVFGLTFAMAYPRKVFSEEDMMTPLSQLGLVPSAALMLTKTPRS